MASKVTKVTARPVSISGLFGVDGSRRCHRCLVIRSMRRTVAGEILQDQTKKGIWPLGEVRVAHIILPSQGRGTAAEGGGGGVSTPAKLGALRGVLYPSTTRCAGGPQFLASCQPNLAKAAPSRSASAVLSA